MGINTGVKYIGKEAVYEDNILGTGLTWRKWETHILPVVMAKEFLKHSGVFAEVPEASYLILRASDNRVVFDAAGTEITVQFGLRGGRAGAIGDSLTELGRLSWFNATCLYSNGRLRRAINAGVFGQTTTTMAGRIVTDLPRSAKLETLFVGGGTNDTAISDSITVRNIIGMCRYGQTIGADPCIVLMPPRSDNATNRDKIISKRAAVIAAAKAERILLIDPYRNFISPDGGWAPGISIDGLHPSSHATVRAAARDALLQLAPHLADGWNGLHALTGVPGAIITTNDFLADTNMDGAPDGWAGYASGGSPVVAKSTIASDLSNVWRMETTGLNGSGVAVAGERVEERTISGLTLAAGDRIAIAGRVSLSGADSGISCHVRCLPSGGSSALALEPTIFSGDLDNAIVWAETTVPAGGSASILIQFRLVTTGTVAPSVGAVELSQLQLWNLTQMGIA